MEQPITTSDLIRSLGPAVVGLIAGVLGAYVASRLRMRELVDKLEVEQRQERLREQEKARIQYLAPLRVAAIDLLDRLREIRMKLASPESSAQLVSVFREIKGISRDDPEYRVAWCNGQGHFAMASLYVTALYFAHASAVRRDLPLLKLDPAGDRALLDRLTAVRSAFGGEFGIWEPLQDSLGAYIRRPDGAIMNYREFCDLIIDRRNSLWFLRLIDFYFDIHLKAEVEIPRTIAALEELDGLLADMARPRSA